MPKMEQMFLWFVIFLLADLALRALIARYPQEMKTFA